MIKRIPAVLVLEDGTYYKGWSFQTEQSKVTIGEVVFNTGMTGYQEIITDPSYFQQIVTFTYPEIGNTGINSQDIESQTISIKGLVAKNICKISSSWRQQESLIQYLNRYQIPFIFGIDTRSLTQYLRRSGTMNGCISNRNLNRTYLQQKLSKFPSMTGLDLIPNVTTNIIYNWDEKSLPTWYLADRNREKLSCQPRVVVIDFGVKFNILRRLATLGCEIIVMPALTPMEDILSYNPDGILLSNGPGDPSAVNYGIQTVKELLNQNIPIFGICMGHQILNLALEGKTFKLKFGHRGINHPSGLKQQVEITSQNHGFAVDLQSVLASSLQVTHFNLNDTTVAGIGRSRSPYFSVQYHPESSPGPHDADYLFEYFLEIMKQFRQKAN
ncbi:carbamoyl-phosphate synthase arginine-specific small subunit (chloroplast) [Porphyra umbilicalis]|uniref:Carbamoyl phosphate synthase small chain n=1 Tax=Porphyra umbilicalis TaxID=2786 RepID=J7F5N3_PORUM|nr:carbamoyl-phosphate synthase arginine-specific small subunit [Porphyra umbilicalis]AFC39871.1 carbamoyl-phosphate synthase arginine-specific small subunit [Porphyra umbilicalis]ASN78675.1 carbamoyl-phosphate synthase arginine-specific small subunit [Porphyra umbilicalis]|eukprot:ASN78675.1 carbamoyl-phosphate synthase arginine-specific small subunit (chloroplast) [Porphyra umbilicalis]